MTQQPEDRELLEMAAKAAGLTTKHKWKAERLLLDPPVLSLVVYRDGELSSTGWNPLKNDGDALRLAVKLGLVCSPGTLIFTNDDDLMGAWADKDQMHGTGFYQQVSWSLSKGDPYAATRRAIVRAAAEIGRATP